MSNLPGTPNSLESLVALAPSSSVPLEQNPAAIYLASLSPGSRITMRTALNILGEMMGIDEFRGGEGHDMRCLAVPWASLRAQHTAALRASLEERYAPATANKLLAALRRVLKESRRLGAISADDYEKAADVPNIRAPRLPRGRLVVPEEIAALMRACAIDSTPAGARDAALIASLCGSGLRRSEAVALDLADYNATQGTIIIRARDGHEDRIVYAPAGTRLALDAWIAVRGYSPGPLFYGLVKGGSLVVRRLAAQAVALVCAARRQEAGVAPFTPHDLRRTFISGLLDAGADMAIVQQLAGHEAPATTARYDRRSEAAKQRAIELVHIPYYPRDLQEAL